MNIQKILGEIIEGTRAHLRHHSDGKVRAFPCLYFTLFLSFQREIPKEMREKEQKLQFPEKILPRKKKGENRNYDYSLQPLYPISITG